MALLSTPLKKRVRTFLTESGAPPRAELTRNYEQICVVMQRRRADDAFWAPLTELLRDLVDSVVKTKNPNAPLPPEARLLALWDVHELAQLLRAALPREPQPDAGVAEPSPGTQWLGFSSGLSPNALGLLLLLSLAASACSSSDSNSGASSTATTGDTVATGGVGKSPTAGGKTGVGGANKTATGGTSHSGGLNGLGSNGATTGNIGGAAFGGNPATGAGGDSLTSGGSSHSGAMSSLGGTAGNFGGSGSVGGGRAGAGAAADTVTAGGKTGLAGATSATSGGTTHSGGTYGLAGKGGTAEIAGGRTGTGGAALTCQRDAGSAAGAATVAGHPLPTSCCVDTASELWQTIDGSTLSSSQKQSLYTCFANLNATWCDGLVDLFKTATPQVIAQYLSDLLNCCMGAQYKFNGDFATVRQELINRLACNVVLYKGVTFPS